MSIAYPSLNHALRVPLAAEVHSRPSLRLSDRESLTHLAVYAHDDKSASNNHALEQQKFFRLYAGILAWVRRRLMQSIFFMTLAGFACSGNVIQSFPLIPFHKINTENLTVGTAFKSMPLQYIPQEWLLSLQGKVMVAAHVVLDKAAAPDGAAFPDMRNIFEGQVLVGSQVVQGGEDMDGFPDQGRWFLSFCGHG